MANPQKLIFFFILSLTIFSPSLSSNPNSDIHDLFPKYGLPIGLLPNAVKSYTISPTTGSFQIELTHSCYVQFDYLVYYDKIIKGKLTYGSVSDVSGIQAKELFLWVTVTGMDVDKSSGMIEFHVGPLSRKMPSDQFQTIPTCKNKACLGSSSLPQSI